MLNFLVSRIFGGRDRHSLAPKKLNIFWPQEDVSEERADYLFLSCTAARTIVAHGMWPVLA